jgi:hypothetical protein
MQVGEVIVNAGTRSCGYFWFVSEAQHTGNLTKTRIRQEQFHFSVRRRLEREFSFRLNTCAGLLVLTMPKEWLVNGWFT